MSSGESARRFVRLFRDEEIPFKAASVAFYAIASFVPLLILTVAVLTWAGVANQVVGALESSLSSAGAQVVEEALAANAGRRVASGIGLLALLWSATRIFRGLSVAFAGLYEREADLSLAEEVATSLAVFVAFLVALLVLGGAAVAVAVTPLSIPVPGLVWNALAGLALVGVLLPLYYVLPPESVTIRHALPGAVLTAVGWVLLRYGFEFYVRNAGSYATYGVLGGLLVFVTFLYVAALVLLVGAAVNVALDW